MGMQAGMDRAASWGEAVWRVWEDAPEPVRYGALCLIAIYAIWLVLFFTQRRILYFTDPTRIHPTAARGRTRRRAGTCTSRC